jgi:flavin-binding protein dodecin
MTVVKVIELIVCSPKNWEVVTENALADIVLTNKNIKIHLPKKMQRES